MSMLNMCVKKIVSFENSIIHRNIYHREFGGYRHVVLFNGHQYLIFRNKKYSKLYAIDMFVKYFDDVQILDELCRLGMSVKMYASHLICTIGIEGVVSYDTKHVMVSDDYIGYRII